MESMRRIVVAMDLASTGKGGGPYTSSTRIMKSGLSKKYDYKVLHYDTSLGRGVSIKRIRDLARQLKEINPDIVHFTGLQLSGFHIIVACRLAGFKNTVVTVRGFSVDALYFNPIKRMLMRFILEPVTLLLTKKIYGVSEYVASRKLLRLFGHKLYGAIYNFPPRFEALEDKNEVRAELGINSNDIVIVTVARIVKDKGYHIYDKAIQKFKGVNNVKFIVVGQGSYLEEMKGELRDQVDQKQVLFLGYREDIGRILSACNIFVLPTLHETLSVALLEASQYNLALVASRTGGVPEIVEDGYNGYLVTPGNIDELYQAIQKLIEDRVLIDTFGRNAKMRIGDKFSVQSIEEKIEEVYKSLKIKGL